jgi:hypothetical protein
MKIRGILVLAFSLICAPALAQVDPGTTPLTIAKGGTAASTAAAARTNLGLGSIATQNTNALDIIGVTLLTGLPVPINPSDAARLIDVQNAAAGLTFLPSSTLAATSALPNTPTYANGTAGVGATLTAGANSTLTVDSAIAALNTVILVAAQASAFQNGIYIVTAAGSGSAPWVMTRVTYFNQSTNMLSGSVTSITGGATNSAKGFALQATVTTVGTTAVTFNLSFSAGVTSIAGNTGSFTLGGGVVNSTNQIQEDGNYTGWVLQNCTLASSVGSSLLTVALKDNAGNDPSTTSPCNINYRSATAASGVTALVPQTAALSISTFATGATLGSSSNKAFRFWVVVFNNGGVNVLALINCTTPSGTLPLNESMVASSTPMSGSATSAGVFYSPNGTTVTSKAFRIVGYVEYNSTGITTAGTYASPPNFVQVFGAGIKKPGDIVQVISGPTITATSAANLILASATRGWNTQSVSNTSVTLIRGSTTIAQTVVTQATSTSQGTLTFSGILDAPNSISSQTYALSAGTGNPNGTAYYTLEEIQG